MNLKKVLTKLDTASPEDAEGRLVLIGGPVERERGFVLHTDDWLIDDASVAFADGLAMTGTREALTAMTDPEEGPDRSILLLGYAWLAFGLLLLGLGLLLPALSLSATLHALSVGALGSLTFAVMARTRLLYRFRDPAARPWIQAMALLISLAALARVVPALLALPQPGWLLIAAGCWSLAFLSLALLLWQCRAAHVDSPRAQPDR